MVQFVLKAQLRKSTGKWTSGRQGLGLRSHGLGDMGFGRYEVWGTQGFICGDGTTSENHGIEDTSNVLNIQYVNCTSIFLLEMISRQTSVYVASWATEKKQMATGRGRTASVKQPRRWLSSGKWGRRSWPHSLKAAIFYLIVSHPTTATFSPQAIPAQSIRFCAIESVTRSPPLWGKYPQ